MQPLSAEWASWYEHVKVLAAERGQYAHQGREHDEPAYDLEDVLPWPVW